MLWIKGSVRFEVGFMAKKEAHRRPASEQFMGCVDCAVASVEREISERKRKNIGLICKDFIFFC